MRIRYPLLLLFLLPTLVISQANTAIASAEISFVFLSNDTEGTVAGFRSTSKIDTETPSNSVFEGEVQTETLETGNFLRNWSLRGGKYFDVDTYPTMKYRSTEVKETENGYTVEGKLTIKDVTKSIPIVFTRNGKELTGTMTLYSSDFGINIKKQREDNKVSVKMVFRMK